MVDVVRRSKTYSTGRVKEIELKVFSDIACIPVLEKDRIRVAVYDFEHNRQRAHTFSLVNKFLVEYGLSLNLGFFIHFFIKK